MPRPAIEYITVTCFCKGKNPGCVKCDGTGELHLPACKRCSGKGTVAGMKCLDCRGDGWRPLDLAGWDDRVVL